MNDDAVRVALVTDIHADGEHGTKRGEQALELLDGFVERINALPDHSRPDVVVDLGDRVNDVDAITDRRALEAVAEVFSRLTVPRVHLLGNHDVVNLSLQDNAEVLGTRLESRFVELHGWQLVFWYANPTLTSSGFRFLPEDLEWLEGALASSDKPSAVFTHAPYSGASMLGNHYFEPYPQFAGYGNAHLVRPILERSGVPLCVAGHVHWNSVTTVDGTHHLSLQSLTESFTTHPDPAKAWGALTLGQTVWLEVFGLDPIKLELPVKPGGHRWVRAFVEELEREA